PRSQAQPTISDADRQLKALYEGYADWTQKEFGFFPDAKGENQPAGYLPKVDAAAQQARAEHLKSVLAQLDAIPAAHLSPGERGNAGVLRPILNASISDAKFREWEMPVNSD